MKDYKCSICKNTPVIKQTIHFFIDLPQIQKGL
jgi:methionyl-tRNA synthetase